MEMDVVNVRESSNEKQRRHLREFLLRISHFLYPRTHVDIKRLATVSTGWNRASSVKPATADPMIRAAPLPPDDWIGLVAVTDKVDLSSLRVIVMRNLKPKKKCAMIYYLTETFECRRLVLIPTLGAFLCGDKICSFSVWLWICGQHAGRSEVSMMLRPNKVVVWRDASFS